MAILAAMLTIILPETLGRPLPMTIAEVEGWSRTISKKDRKKYLKEKDIPIEYDDETEISIMEPV